MLAAVYGSKAEEVIGKTVSTNDPQEQQLMQELWDANEDVFKAVFYQIYSDKKDILARLGIGVG